MATNKNITMKQFNGTDYDTLYPKTIASQIPDVYSKTEVLTTETLSKYGLTADKLPNDVFQQIKTLIDGKARVQTGSYVGTGTNGSNTRNSLTFNFMPVLVAIDTGDVLSKNVTCPPFVRGCTYTSYYDKSNQGVTVSWTDNSVSWYSAYSSATQMNVNDTTYYYVAITI